MEEKTLRQLNIYYFASVTALATLFVLSILNIVRFSKTPQPVNLTVEMYAVVITIVMIPVALKMFAERLKKIRQKGLNPSEAIKQYKTAYFVRFYAFMLLAIGNILLYMWSWNMNFFWLTVVLLVVFLFCKSSEKEIFSMTEKDDISQKNQE
ncbi:MAG: hypothetical protein LBR48_06775 [Dysgonamonadaceae bacterium]|jgi:uncharacterized membrane protein YhaH (DUF805 family)|nr:hypothetical protein [Dysgonamonadaceae bacterium]